MQMPRHYHNWKPYQYRATLIAEEANSIFSYYSILLTDIDIHATWSILFSWFPDISRSASKCFVATLAHADIIWISRIDTLSFLFAAYFKARRSRRLYLPGYFDASLHKYRFLGIMSE